MPLSLKPVNMLHGILHEHYMADKIKVTGPLNKEIIVPYPDGPNIITQTLKSREPSLAAVREMLEKKSERLKA